MDKIDTLLNSFATNTTLSAAIRASSSLGKQLLNKYYARTDESEIYRIAMDKSSLFLSSCLIV